MADQKLKDPGLQKALAAYGKIDAQKAPDQATEALAEVAEQATKLKKANQSNKEVAAYLDEVLKEATKTKQSLATALKGQEASKEDEEEESPEIKGKLINALKKVKDAGGKDAIGFVACVAKPVYGVLLAKDPNDRIGLPHKQILTDLTGENKFILGNCLFENEAHTFVVDPVPNGLAKNLKKALKEHTGLTYHVRARDPEGKVVLDSETDVDEEETTARQPQTETSATGKPSSPAPHHAATDEAIAKFTSRFKALQPDILKATGAKTPQGEEIKQKAAEAAGLATKNDFEGAHRFLDGVETLLKQSASSTAPSSQKPTDTPKPTSESGTTREIRLSTYLKGRSDLRIAREQAAKGLALLRQAILAKAKDEPFYNEVEAKSQRLFDFLTPIDDSVVNKLDEAGNCNDPERQAELNKQTRDLIQKQLAALRGHALASFVEKNPFGKFIIKQPLEVTLSALDKQLS